VVIVQRQGRYVLCRTFTGDFDDSEIRFAVHDCGQLYLDVSGKLEIDDFGHDVEQMVLADECRECPEFDTCVACYRPTAGSFFHEDEQWISRELSGMSGAVLDVGMGQIPYFASIAPGIESGVIEMRGLDPDPETLKRVQEDGLPLELHQGKIEDFRGMDGVFDHVIALRSLNHFDDVGIAIETMTRCLKPGGRLMMVESIVMPLVRSKEQSGKSHENAPGGFQHYRNWDSSKVLELVEARGLLYVEYHRPISPDTCDQWILKLRRHP